MQVLQHADEWDVKEESIEFSKKKKTFFICLKKLMIVLSNRRVEDLFSLKAFANHLDQDFVQPLLPLNLKNKND